MDKYESYALGHFLSEWPDENMSFTDLMQQMREGDTSEIWPWELVECVPLEDLAGLIEDMVITLRGTFK